MLRCRVLLLFLVLRVGLISVVAIVVRLSNLKTIFAGIVVFN
jgi:hypothetical protein